MHGKTWVRVARDFEYAGTSFPPGVNLGCDPNAPEVIAGLEDGTLEPGEIPEEAQRRPPKE